MSQGKLSIGGQVVDESLAILGYDTQTAGTAMVETASPRRRYSRVLLQSAWNVLPEPEFQERMKRYPSRMRQRAMARRSIARWNMRRADEVVCLTHAVASLLFKSTGLEGIVVPVSCPIVRHDAATEVAVQNDQVLVPGTLTWYKEPLVALELIASSRGDLGAVTIQYLGRDDGSGCWSRVERRADELGVRVKRSVASRDDMPALYRASGTTILPSSLESLGFGLAEALLYVPSRVIASPIPSHREIARRVGIEPQWIGSAPRSVEVEVSPFPSKAAVENEWHALANALGLAAARPE